jgi:hypothetical protein
VRKEAQDRLMEESLARSQLMLRGMGGGSTALPGIISSYGAQAAQRGAQAGAGLLRGVSGGIGQMVGGETGQRIADLGVPMEERQAREGQEALKGMKSNDPESIRNAAERLRQLGLVQASAQLEAQASRVEEAKRRADLEERRVAVAEKSQEATERQTDERLRMQQESNEWTKEYQQGQQELQRQGLDLRTQEFNFRVDEAGKISPAEQARIDIAKQQLELQRRKFDELSPYQQAQLEYQEKQIELAEQRIDLQSDQAQAQLEDSRKRLQIQEAQLYGSFTKDSVDAWKASNGQTPLEPRPRANELPVPRSLDKNTMRDFDAALSRLPEELQGAVESGWFDGVSDEDKKRVIYKEALRLQRIMRDLSDAEVLRIAIISATGVESETTTDTATTDTTTPDLGAVSTIGTGGS